MVRDLYAITTVVGGSTYQSKEFEGFKRLNFHPKMRLRPTSSHGRRTLIELTLLP